MSFSAPSITIVHREHAIERMRDPARDKMDYVLAFCVPGLPDWTVFFYVHDPFSSIMFKDVADAFRFYNVRMPVTETPPTYFQFQEMLGEDDTFVAIPYTDKVRPRVHDMRCRELVPGQNMKTFYIKTIAGDLETLIQVEPTNYDEVTDAQQEWLDDCIAELEAGVAKVEEFEDKKRIDEYFEEQEIEAEGERFVYDNAVNEETEIFTAQDYQEEQYWKPFLQGWTFTSIAPAEDGNGVIITDNDGRKRRHKTSAPDQQQGFSICIPRVFLNIGEQRIRGIFADHGFPEIEQIDFVRRQGRDKRTGRPQDYNRVFVHFFPGSAYQPAIIRKLLNGEQVRIDYDAPWFWMISLSRSPRPVPAAY